MKGNLVFCFLLVKIDDHKRGINITTSHMSGGKGQGVK